MIKQVNNVSVRGGNSHEPDITYLRNYYASHGHFPMFQQVLIETRTDCNNHCPFCPHAFNKKPLGIMTWECYTAIIDQLVSIGYNGRVALMLSNEPLLEDRLEDMIDVARCLWSVMVPPFRMESPRQRIRRLPGTSSSLRMDWEL